MKDYKLKDITSPIKFSMEEIETILKYRFNAQVCSSRLIGKTKLEKGIKERTYHITDLEILESIRSPEESEKIKENINEMLELGLEINTIDKGEEYFINFEFDCEDRIVDVILLGQMCRYLLDETIILRGNNYEQDEMYLNCQSEDGKALIEEVIKKSKMHYMELLEEHGYILERY